jgi:hypothetical protein
VSAHCVQEMLPLQDAVQMRAKYAENIKMKYKK